MKVILKEYVYKHGVAGDVVNVSDGYARNYLIPQGMAIRATPGALRDNQHLIAQAAKRRQELKDSENEQAHKIHGVELVFGMKAGKNNKLYGSVTTMDIAKALREKTGEDVDRRRISDRSLRELGIHEVPVRISASVSPVLKVVIIREEEVEDYLAGKPVRSLGQDVSAAASARETGRAVEAGESVESAEAEELAAAGEEAADVAAEAADSAEGVE